MLLEVLFTDYVAELPCQGTWHAKVKPHGLLIKSTSDDLGAG